jgi:gamma-glutamylcyclotransferase (GGCT)/AIG2-like uncharacterized protein YtfP
MERNVAVYGTLRKGYGLNSYLSEDYAEYIGKAWINGYKMYSFDENHWSYPIVSKTDNAEDKIEIELYKLHDNMSGRDAGDSIDAIEYGAGYHSGMVEVEGEEYKIYLQDEGECLRHFSHIKSGDFNEFTERVRTY